MSNDVIIFVFGESKREPENKPLSIFETMFEYDSTIEVQETEILVYKVKGTNKKAYFVEDGEVVCFGETWKRLRLLNKDEFEKLNISETWEQSANSTLREVTVNE